MTSRVRNVLISLIHQIVNEKTKVAPTQLSCFALEYHTQRAHSGTELTCADASCGDFTYVLFNTLIFRINIDITKKKNKSFQQLVLRDPIYFSLRTRICPILRISLNTKLALEHVRDIFYCVLEHYEYYTRA